jgi:hypothetical protein
VSDVRCPACGASAPAGAQWCSLCFADLRPAAAREPVREPVTVPETPAAELAAEPTAPEAGPAAPEARPAATRVDPLTDPLFMLTADPIVTLPVAVAEPSRGKHAAPAEDKLKWPCPKCGEQVPISLDSCESCGAGFLAGATTRPSTRLPIVGDVGRFTTGQRWLAAGVAALAFTVLLLLVATLSVSIL